MQEEITTPYTRSQADILSNAAATRYGLQAQELANQNQYSQFAYAAPRDFWLNKMKNWYGGLQSYGGSTASSTGSLFNMLNEGANSFANVMNSIKQW